MSFLSNAIFDIVVSLSHCTFRMEQVTIVIPIYKPLSKFEVVSIRQCFTVLDQFPISIVCPSNLNLHSIHSVAAEVSKNISIEVFDSVFFDGIAGYNKLMMSLEFYWRFKKSKYILVYQTDAFVFKDDLEKWCALNYDYVAAPWPFNVTEWIDVYPKEIQIYYKLFGTNKIAKTGNGGLSLRKTKSFINNLKLFSSAASRWSLNEDMFYSHYVNTLNPFFRIPHHDISRKFAFDVNPKEFYELNNCELPFGSHGWYRNDADYEGNLEFYLGIVRSYGYQLDAEN